MLQMEKMVEALLEEMIVMVGEENATQCPAVQLMYQALSNMKSENNAQLRHELGILPNCSGGCCPIKRR
jgi:hypothetical protein